MTSLLKNTPEISIIIPVYNVGKYLHECLDSVRSQTFKSWECILVDDGSTDNTPEICDDYAACDDRFHVLHKKNSGQADSRNIALRMSSGKFVAFVDGDDWIEPDMLSVLYDTIVGNNADISICGHFINTKNGERKSIQDTGVTEVYTTRRAVELLIEDSIVRSFFCDKLFRREVLTVDMPRSFFYEDLATTIKYFLNAKTVAFNRKCCYHYRLRKSSTTGSRSQAIKYYHYFCAEEERYTTLLKRNFFPERNDEFISSIIKTGVRESRDIARYASEYRDALFYINKIKKHLTAYTSTNKVNLKFKYSRRLWQIINISPYFIFIQRTIACIKGRKKFNVNYFD